MTSFLYRTHYEGELSRRVRHLDDPTPLDWFRRVWGRPADATLAELGGEVYGLAAFLERTAELTAPTTPAELGDVLREHLYYEGDLLTDDRSVRVLTDDDEVELAYFFLTDALVAERPDRFAYPVRAEFPLPADADAGTEPVGPGHVVVAPLTFYDSESITWNRLHTIEGIRLPDLAAHLAERPDASGLSPELVLLRAATGPDTDLAAALERFGAWPLLDGSDDGLEGPHADAHAAFTARLRETASRPPERNRVAVGPHLAQLVTHQSDFFGYQQLFLYDDVWAAAHPDLAASLTHYVQCWDPLGEPEE